jgi:HK97 family phage prohead protease
METKDFSFDAQEFKFDDAERTFEGYASVFNGVDAYGDTILPGAYAATLENRSRPVHMYWNHDPSQPIGKWLEIREDARGLWVKGRIAKTARGDDVYALLKEGVVTGMSIGFRIPPGGSERDSRIRKLKRIDLVEVSVVTDPADLSAQVAEVKSCQAEIDSADSLKDIETLLREAGGFSRADATSLVARVKHLARGERDAEEKAANELAELFAKFRAEPPTSKT